MARVRWFGVILGAFQVFSYKLAADPMLGPRVAPHWVRPAALLVLIGFTLVNLVVALVLRRENVGLHVWKRVGLSAFAADCLGLFALVWIFSFDRNSTTWVILYILGLEGALRFQLTGALVPVVAAFPLEIARDLFREHAFAYPFDVSSATYRVGIMAIVASVAGIMGRNLERERSKEHSAAERERASREESEAFHRVVLAGLQGGDPTDTVDRVVDAMASIFGYEAFAVALTEEPPQGPSLRCVAAHGFPSAVVGQMLPLTEGICGKVARTGTPMIVADVGEEPSYIEWMPGIRSEMCVPITTGDRVIGIVDVESPTLGRFTPEDLQLLRRLAPQIGLVIMNSRLLEQERATVQRLRDLDQMKSDFVAITSHELRTPLTSIRGFVKTMRRPEALADTQEAEQYLAVIDRQSERLSKLVEDLLVVSRIEAGTVRLERQRVEMKVLLGHLVEELGAASERVSVVVEGDVPPLWTDGERLGQVVRNLVENGLKFSSDPVRVLARRAGGELVIEVTDHGTGIPEDEVDRIFDRFYQVGGSMGRRAQGAGLGLYIARWLVEALGGRIGVASTPGEGTTFTVSLPLDAVEEAVRRTG